MEWNKYQDGLIYTIKTDNGIYVGSTIDFSNRKKNHNENIHRLNTKLYKNIREKVSDAHAHPNQMSQTIGPDLFARTVAGSTLNFGSLAASTVNTSALHSFAQTAHF